MFNNIDILEDFKNGNSQQRLYLYMQYRDLRSNFDQIEQEESSVKIKESTVSPQTVINPYKNNSKQSLAVRIKSCCF